MRADLLARYRDLLARYDTLERPAGEWQRMVARLEAGEAVWVHGWQLRGAVPVEKRARWFMVYGDGRLVELDDVPR